MYILNLMEMFTIRVLVFPLTLNVLQCWLNYSYDYDNDFLDMLPKQKQLHLARHFDLCFRYSDDLICLNNKVFAEYVCVIYLPELELKETIDLLFNPLMFCLP